MRKGKIYLKEFPTEIHKINYLMSFFTRPTNLNIDQEVEKYPHTVYELTTHEDLEYFLKFLGEDGFNFTDCNGDYFSYTDTMYKTHLFNLIRYHKMYVTILFADRIEVLRHISEYSTLKNYCRVRVVFTDLWKNIKNVTRIKVGDMRKGIYTNF